MPESSGYGALAVNSFRSCDVHDLDVAGIEPQLLADLQVRQVQPHEVQAQDPDAQWLMLPGQDRPGQIVEPGVT